MELREFSDDGEFGRFSQLLDQGFQLPTDAHYFDDFPVWKRDFVSKESIRLGAYVSGKLVSALAVRKALLRLGKNKIIPIGLMGGVVTDELSRGEGYASKLIEQATAWSVRQGISAIFLWGSEHSLYRRLGFELCGDQARAPLVDIVTTAKTLAFEVREGWNNSIWDVLREREGGLELNSEDRKWYEHHKNVFWISAWEAGKLCAYAAFERGVDLKHLVHEWGGSRDALMVLFEKILERDPQAQLLGHPAQLESKLKVAMGRDVVEEFLCMGKILRPDKILEVGLGGASFEVKKLGGIGERWLIQIEGEPVQSLKAVELARYLFGPRNSAHFQGSRLPLPLWFWGLDAC